MGRGILLIAHMSQKFKSLRVWQASMSFAEELHPYLIKVDDERDFAMSHQLRKSLISIPSNIAEGAESGTNGVFIRHLNIALGSLAELRTQILLCVVFKYFSAEECRMLEKQLDGIEWSLIALKRAIGKSKSQSLKN
jgi:four helix bundle protein